MRRNRGQTLAEELIVIAIIAILAAILFPVFARSRAMARRTQCLSNLKQIAAAALMYAQDYDSVFPLASSNGDKGSCHPIDPAARWSRDIDGDFGYYSADIWVLPDLLAPYVKSFDIFQCSELIRRSEDFRLETVVKPANDRFIPGVRKVGRRYEWDGCGSYCWSCCHFGDPTTRQPGGTYPEAQLCWPGFIPGKPVWDLAYQLHFIGDDEYNRPEDFWVCGNDVGIFDDPAGKPMAACMSWGCHAGYSWQYSCAHTTPMELGGTAPLKPISTPMAFVDGHVKYMQLGFYHMLGVLTEPNQIQ